MANMIRELFSPPFYPGIIGIGWIIFMLFVISLPNRRTKKTVPFPSVPLPVNSPPPPPPGRPVTGLPDAVVPIPQGLLAKMAAPAYTVDDLRMDLYNKSLSIDEIMAKCGHLNPDDIEKVVKELESGGDRRLARLSWHASMLRKQGAVKIVPPPPVQLVVRGSMEHCKACVNARWYGSGSRPYCPSCKGKGFVFIQRG